MRTHLPALGALLAALAAPASADAGPAAASPEVLARGEQVMRRFCLSCHGSPEGRPKVEDPIGPRLRPEIWGDPARAYDAIGQLSRVNRRMDQPFTGSDDDRRALAAWLAHRAAGNVEPPWRRAVPWALGGASLLATGLLLARIRRRG
ncbi:MAG: cytochrome c [Anaeromyxobacteraceae bacterium]